MNKKAGYFLQSGFILVWICIFALILRWSVLEVYMMPYQEMLPTLYSKDHVVANKLAYGLRIPFAHSYIYQWSEPQRGDVVVFLSPYDPKSLSIRRIVGVPGDRVFFENGNLYVNEEKVQKQIPFKRKKDFLWLRDEDFSYGGNTEDKSHYIHWEETLSSVSYSILLKKNREGYLIFGPYRVPESYYFVMGDHRDQSQDSRTWPSGIHKAEGRVTFSREESGPSVLIPKGTVLRTADLTLPEYFETAQEVELTGFFIDVNVIAKKAGLAGNVGAGAISVIEGNLFGHLSVSNDQALTGGKDENLISARDILGKITVVWFSCEKNLNFISFLCDPRYMRWDRTFFSINN